MGTGLENSHPSNFFRRKIRPRKEPPIAKRRWKEEIPL
ncbi:hypothetical protein HDEF_1472 [Candidatus Hamiltonella defensa 5AT (Acyrthosiphon pisum)]|uniref:Uncharacterized protein n=1 Tax=Hamiltonella defensa subsp. Acyrthosiphon pisum (strain 5AT) TaxID=572265 RepID=C4K6A3_HAMD5|nr:hypothetical protein HDEF_1472 [Candidatus Hamiltonella defensa 5AT (Acyrthosiphon pisum)]